jgi:hypothetical protein
MTWKHVDRLVRESVRGFLDGLPHDLDDAIVAHAHRRPRCGRHGVRERIQPENRDAVDRLALEAIVSGGEHAEQLAQRHIVERGLGALEEELGDPEFLVGPLAFDLEEEIACRPEDAELVPVLSVDDDVNAQVLVRGVVLEVDPRLFESHARRLQSRHGIDGAEHHAEPSQEGERHEHTESKELALHGDDRMSGG